MRLELRDIAIGAYVLSEISTTAGFIENTTAYNSTELGQESLSTLASWLPIIALVVAATLMIGLLISAFRARE